MDLQYKLEGLDAVLKKMRALPVDVRMKGARYAMRKSANLVRDAAVMNAEKLNDPKTREEISKNIAVRFASREAKRTGDVMFRVGVLGGAMTAYSNTRYNRRKRLVGKAYQVEGDIGNPGGDTFYWRFLEFGTQHIGARPFMRPALEQNIGAATDEFTKHLDRWLDRYFKRNGIAPPSL